MKTKKTKFSLKRLEDSNVILFNGIETGYIRKKHLERMESVINIINSENSQLYVNLERDYLDSLEIKYPSEWETHYQNNISFSNEDCPCDYKDGYVYFVEVFQNETGNTMVVFYYNH